MKAPFSLFLALRYLKPKRTFVSVITVISVLGVTLGIAVLIIVISVMTGFDRELQRKVLGFDAHIVVKGDGPLHNWRPVDEALQKVPGVLTTSPYVEGPVIAEFGGRVNTPLVRGVDIERELKLANLGSMIREGTSAIHSDQCLVGIAFARDFGVLVGDKVTVFAPRDVGQVIKLLDRINSNPEDKEALSTLKEVVIPAELTVAGIFESGRNQYDNNVILTTLHNAQELYGLEDDIHGLGVRTPDPYHLDAINTAMRSILPLDYRVASWMDLNSEFFDAIRVERTVMFFILFFIIIVAAFSVMNTLITVTVQKRRDIGIMKALGATPAQIVWVFLVQGMIVGFMGNLTGVTAGMVMVHWRNEFKAFLASVLHIEIFPARIYQFSQLPAEVVPQDVAIICISTFFICSLAALVPAWNAARLDPVKALRYE